MLKRSQPKRDWSDARAKVEAEGICRMAVSSAYPPCDGPLEAAHIIGRELDLRAVGVTITAESRRAPKGLTHHVKPKRIAPLCRCHHRLYDSHEVDLLPYLTLDEQLQAVADAGGIELARVRLCPSLYKADRGRAA